MANKPDTNKKQLGVLITLSLYAKIRKAASEHHMTVTDYVSWILTSELNKVELTAEDYIWISEQVRHNEIKRSQGRK